MPPNRRKTALLALNVVRDICNDLRRITALPKTAQEALQHEIVTEVASPEKIVAQENLRCHRERVDVSMDRAVEPVTARKVIGLRACLQELGHFLASSQGDPHRPTNAARRRRVVEPRETLLQ